MSIDAAMYARLREIAQQVARYGKVEIADGQAILTLLRAPSTTKSPPVSPTS